MEDVDDCNKNNFDNNYTHSFSKLKLNEKSPESNE